MPDNTPVSSDHYNKKTANPDGFRDKRGEWRPAKGIAFAPIFVWPARVLEFLLWLRSYLFSWNILWFGLTLVTWRYFQPSLETCRTFQASWIAQMFIRNMILLWVVYGSWHLHLYVRRGRGHRGKYSPRWQSTNGSTFMFKNQVYDNVFWTCGSGCITWTAYEVVTMWMYANHHLPYLDPKSSPVAFVAVLLLIPFWREFHFYWIHRLIHWKPLYDRIHYLHHYNINPGPWSGMAMHPVEHLLYFSVTLIHWIIPSHPIHFLFNAQHTALTPAAGHSGFEGKLAEQVSFGSYFHYLHHRHFDCNYGESTLPLDKWFGSFEDGSRTGSEKSEARRTYHDYVIDRIVEESPEVKSFYFRRADGVPPEPYAPGQHLMFKVPAAASGNLSLRFYTLSDVDGGDTYRISVKREGCPPGQPELPPGMVSNYMHDSLKVGDPIEARGPLGDFTPNLRSSRPVVLVAGGIGITPILSMLKGCLRRHPKRRIHLFLAFRDPRHQVFKDEVEALLKAHPQVTCHTFFDEIDQSELHGRPNTFARRIGFDAIKEALPHLQMDFYVCGPPAMMTAITGGLEEAGVDAEHIHTESFNQGNRHHGQDPVSSEQHEITFTRSDQTFQWDSEFKNLLEFAESNGISMEAGCMFGECGACSVKVGEGEVDYNYLTATKPQAGHCLPCSCRPKSAMRIEA
jgi:ferredoxin-NADP reductase/sterol desaturase/sphingolipid hydroxylase (fatty acid hydroxylase superfamily)